jgi:hypothetical protein
MESLAIDTLMLEQSLVAIFFEVDGLIGEEATQSLSHFNKKKMFIFLRLDV